MLHINLNGALYIKNDFFYLFFWGAFELLHLLLLLLLFINSFRLLAFNFSYIKYASPLPHHLKCAPPSPGPIIFFLNFGYTLHHRIFKAILTCSTIKTLPSGSQKKKTFLRKRWLLSFLFFFFWLKCTTTPKMALYWFFLLLFLFEYTIIFVVIIKLL